MDRKDLIIRALSEQVGVLSGQLAEVRADLTLCAAQARRLGQRDGYWTLDGKDTGIVVEEAEDERAGTDGAH